MSTEGIPTPRSSESSFYTTNADDQYDLVVPFALAEALETELFLANQKLQAIRELAEKAKALNLDLLPLNSFTKILNS